MAKLIYFMPTSLDGFIAGENADMYWSVPDEMVDEYHLLVVPFMLGGGKRILPAGVSIKLDLLDDRRAGNGWVYLRYRTRA